MTVNRETLSPNQASQIANVSRGTVMNAISAGDLAASRNNKNQWQINRDDLTAWMQARGVPDNAKAVATDNGRDAAKIAELTADNRRLADLLHAASERIADKDDQIARLRSEVDQERADRRALQESIMQRRGIWARIIGR